MTDTPRLNLTLTYLAPIPVGDEVDIVTIETPGLVWGWNVEDPILIDRATKIVWGPAGIPDGFSSEEGAGSDGATFREKSRRRGVVVLCVIESRGNGKYNHLQTKLSVARSA